MPSYVQYPKTLIEFEEWFKSEEACRDYLFRLRWPDGFKCPNCGLDKAWLLSRELYHCNACNFQTSLTAGTIFHGTRKPLQTWFRAMWYVTNQKHGVSAMGLQRVLGLGSYHTAWTWLHKLRVAMVRPGRDRLTGIVEVDETYIGGKKPGKRGRGAEGKALVFIAAQLDRKRIGRIRLCRIDDASMSCLEAATQKTIEPGTVVHTDDWNGYNNLKLLGYVHDVVRKDAHIGDNLLPRANLVASLLKRWLLGIHQGAVRHTHLDYYLDEFTFRFNRRTSRSRGKLFYRLMQQAVAIEPVVGKHFKGGISNNRYYI
jgi:transposase-like protein